MGDSLGKRAGQFASGSVVGVESEYRGQTDWDLSTSAGAGPARQG